MEPVGVKDASYVEPFHFYSYHTWAPVSQRSVSCFLPFSLSPSASWNGGFSGGPCHIYEIWPWKMKYLSAVRLLIALSSAQVMGGTGVHSYEFFSYAFCREPMPESGERQPTDGTASFWCHCMWGHTPPSALCKLQSSCCHLAHKCHSRSLTSISLHKIWGCAMDF